MAHAQQEDDVIWSLLIHVVSDSSKVMNTMLCEPHPFCCSWSCEMHVSNNKEMAFNYIHGSTGINCIPSPVSNSTIY